MSNSTIYSSFDEVSADLKWNNFDAVINDAFLAKNKKIDELEKKLLESDEYDVAPELIYNPLLKDEYAKKQAEIVKNKEKWKAEIKTLKEEGSDYDSGIFYYIKNKEPIEPEGVMSQMVGLDLDFGGHSVSFDSSGLYSERAENALRIMFPNLESVVAECLSRNDIVTIGNNIGEVNARFDENKEIFLKEIELESQDEEGVRDLKEEVKDFLTALIPVIRDVIKNNARFFCWSDSDDFPEDESLKTRALKHIEQFKNHPIMKIPLQDYDK